MTVPLICLAHEDHLSYPPNGKFFFYQGILNHFVEKMLFNSCIFLKRLARHGNTHVEPEKMQRPWPTLFLSTNLQQVLGRGIHHLRWHSITGQFLDFLVAEMTQFDVFW